MFKNLEVFAQALGFPGITLEFLKQMQGNVGAFTRLAAQHDLPLMVGVQAKREFVQFMEQGVAMFSTTEPWKTPIPTKEQA